MMVDWLTDSCPVEVGRGFVHVKEDDGETRMLRVIASRRHGKRHVVTIEGILSRNDAEKLRGATFFLPADELPDLPEGEFFCYQILGLNVVTQAGDEIGTVTRIFTAGDHDVYEVTGMKEGKKREVLIPVIKDVIVKVDLDSKTIVINPLKGLLDE